MDSAQIVARFLRANHYNETLQTFIREAGLSEDAGSLGPGQWTIEQILEEKRQFDTSINFEKAGDGGVLGWSENAPTTPHEPQVDMTSNVLCVKGGSDTNTVTVTSADRSSKGISGAAPYALEHGPHMGESPVLSVEHLDNNYMLTTSMSGHLALRQSKTNDLIDQCRHHSKYVVQSVSHMSNDTWIVVTAAWDQKILFYAPDLTAYKGLSSRGVGPTASKSILGEPFHVQSLPSNPESIVLVQNPDTLSLYLIASRRDSTHLYYYKIEKRGPREETYVVNEAGRQNLAPHSNAWVAFTPCSLSKCPSDPTLLAVATSHIPHMKLILVRLLFPGSSIGQFTASELQTQASVARADLALQDREDAAIKLHVTTMAPQTPYSTPQVVWRPDGSGLFVNGDDGVIRGVETTTGKVVSLLKGHDFGSKVRTLWAGKLQPTSEVGPVEVLVSGGFDKKLLIWTSVKH